MMSHPPEPRPDRDWRLVQLPLRQRLFHDRHIRGLTQAQVAIGTGMSRIRYCRLELGLTRISAADLATLNEFYHQPLVPLSC